MNSPKRTEKSNDAQQVVRYFWRHLCSYPRSVVGIFSVIPFTILINSYLPSLILASVLSRLSTHHYVNGHMWQSFGPTLIIYAILLASGIVAWRVVDVFAWRLEQNIQRDIAQEIFRHMLGRSADFHANNFSGSLVSHANKLLSGYVRMADTTFFQAYPMVSGIIIAITILSFRAPMFAVALAVFATVFLTAAFFASRPVRRLGAEYAEHESKQTGFLADAVTNVMAIKSFARAEYEEKRFAKVTNETHRLLRVFAKAHQRQMNTLGFMSRVISSSALLIAVVAVMKFHANIGTVFLIFNYTAITLEQLFNFSNNSLRNYNRAIGDTAEMVQTLAEAPEVQDPAQPERPRMGRGAIEFKDVTFTHNGADDAVFNLLNLAIKPGERIGLVGHSGSGKSTFTRLLMRFSDIQGGEILIDGQNIARVTQADLHRQIAYVPQEPLLFHRTIRENIAYGHAHATDHEVETAAKMASAHDFILALPQGYDTLVGERGVKLSGGQRQRVAIDRAILKQAPILVLDEATSALVASSNTRIG